MQVKIVLHTHQKTVIHSQKKLKGLCANLSPS